MSHCSHEMEDPCTAYCITRVREGPIKVLLVYVCLLVMMIKDKDIKELIDLYRIHPIKDEWKNLVTHWIDGTSTLDLHSEISYTVHKV